MDRSVNKDGGPLSGSTSFRIATNRFFVGVGTEVMLKIRPDGGSGVPVATHRYRLSGTIDAESVLDDMSDRSAVHLGGPTPGAGTCWIGMAGVGSDPGPPWRLPAAVRCPEPASSAAVRRDEVNAARRAEVTPGEEARLKLVGMLDSPYVRRVAISLQLLGLEFEHQSLSVFRTFAEFSRINPVVKAPTLVCDDGQTLMDSSLILQYAEALARPRSLFPSDLLDLQHDLHLIGLALAATEKSVQVVYEQGLRPPEKLHAPWLERVTGQLRAAYGELERALAERPLPTDGARINQAGVTVAVAWHFTQQMIADRVPAAQFPRLAEYSRAAESLPEFIAAPHGDGTYRAGR